MPCSCKRTAYSIGLVYLIGIFGCDSRDASLRQTSKTSQSYRGQEVNLVVPRNLNLPGTWELLLQEWTSQSGATIRWSEFDPSKESPSNQVSDGSFVLFPLNQLCEIERSLGSLSVPEDDFETKDLFKGLRDRGLMRDRTLVASPISVPVLVCYYRKDLLRAAHLNPPETWDDYFRLMETIESWAPGLTAVEPLSPEFRATTFFARSLAYCKHPENYSVWFEIDSAKPTLNTPGFVRALEKTERAWKLLPASAATYSPGDCRQQILSGKAALALGLEPMSADLIARTPNSSSEIHRIDGIELGICRLPGSRTVYNRNSKRWDSIPVSEVHAPALCGFSGLAAGIVYPKGHFKESAAANLLVSLNTPSHFEQAFAALPKGPCRESQLTYAPSWFGPDLSAEEAAEYCDSVARSLRDNQLVFELPVIGADEFRRAASADLERLLKGESDAAAVAEAMQKSFEAIVERLGPESVRDSYRRGLGLGPALKK